MRNTFERTGGGDLRPQRWYVEASSVLVWIIGSLVWAGLIGGAGFLVQGATTSLPSWSSRLLAVVSELAAIILSVRLARGRLRPTDSAIGALAVLGLAGTGAQLFVGAALLASVAAGGLIGDALRQDGSLSVTGLDLALSLLRAQGPFLFGALGLVYLRGGFGFRLTSWRRWAASAAAVLVALAMVGVVWLGARYGFFTAGSLDERSVPAGQLIELDQGCGTVTVPAGWRATVTRAREYPAWTMLSKDTDWQGENVLLELAKPRKGDFAYLSVVVAREAAFWREAAQVRGAPATSTVVALPPGLLDGRASASTSSSVLLRPKSASLRIFVPRARPPVQLTYTVPRSESMSLEPDRLGQTLAPFDLQLHAK
jgi:hypothetical protein